MIKIYKQLTKERESNSLFFYCFHKILTRFIIPSFVVICFPYLVIIQFLCFNSCTRTSRKEKKKQYSSKNLPQFNKFGMRIWLYVAE